MPSSFSRFSASRTVVRATLNLRTSICSLGNFSSAVNLPQRISRRRVEKISAATLGFEIDVFMRLSR